MISRDFIASDFIRKTEWPRIDGNAKESNRLVVPMILGNCRLPVWLDQLQAIPTQDGKLRAISSFNPHDNGYDVAHKQLLKAMDGHFENWRAKP